MTCPIFHVTADPWCLCFGGNKDTSVGGFTFIILLCGFFLSLDRVARTWRMPWLTTARPKEWDHPGLEVTTVNMPQSSLQHYNLNLSPKTNVQMIMCWWGEYEVHLDHWRMENWQIISYTCHLLLDSDISSWTDQILIFYEENGTKWKNKTKK